MMPLFTKIIRGIRNLHIFKFYPIIFSEVTPVHLRDCPSTDFHCLRPIEKE